MGGDPCEDSSVSIGVARVVGLWRSPLPLPRPWRVHQDADALHVVEKQQNVATVCQHMMRTSPGRTEATGTEVRCTRRLHRAIVTHYRHSPQKLCVCMAWLFAEYHCQWCERHSAGCVVYPLVRTTASENVGIGVDRRVCHLRSSCRVCWGCGVCAAAMTAAMTAAISQGLLDVMTRKMQSSTRLAVGRGCVRTAPKVGSTQRVCGTRDSRGGGECMDAGVA